MLVLITRPLVLKHWGQFIIIFIFFIFIFIIIIIFFIIIVIVIIRAIVKYKLVI